MLVKFKNDTEEFQNKVDYLKGSLSLGAASKVAEHCVSNYASMEVRNHKLQRKVEKLTVILDSLKEAVQDKRAAEQEINILLGSNF